MRKTSKGAFISMAGSGMQASNWGLFQTTAGGTVTAAVVGGTASALGGGKFANGAVTGAYTMLFNHMVHEGNKKESGNPSRKKPIMGEEYQGTTGIGFSFEIAFPDWIIGDLSGYNGFGLNFGLLRDNNGLGFYATTKSTTRTGFALSAQAEVFVATNNFSSPNTNIDRSYPKGSGYETSLGILMVGGAYGVSNAADYGRYSIYSSYSFSIGLGIDIGYVDWKTKSYITGK